MGPHYGYGRGMVSYMQAELASCLFPISLFPRPGAPGFVVLGILCAPPAQLNGDNGGGSVLHPSFSSNLAMGAVIFMSVALKNWKGHPEHAPYGGGVLWRGRAIDTVLPFGGCPSIFRWTYDATASMLPYLGVMAPQSGTDPVVPLFGTVAGELLLTRSEPLRSSEGGCMESGKPLGGHRELEVVGQYYTYVVGIESYKEVRGQWEGVTNPDRCLSQVALDDLPWIR